MDPRKTADPNIVHRIATGYMGTCVVLAALELGVFDEISRTPRTASRLAEDIGLNPRPLERLLVALASLGLLQRIQGTYSCSPEAERYLVKSSPSYFGDYYRFQVRHCLMPDFLRLDELIRENRAIMSDDWAAFMADPEKAKVFILGQHSASMGGGRMLAAKFDFSPYRRMVDLAGGSGACSIAACRSNPALTSVIVDFPNVLRVAEEIIQKEGLSGRITTHAGDLRKDDWPAGDVMLISLVVSGFARDDQLAIFGKCFQKLPSGGALIVHDFLLNRDYTGPVLSALYSLTSVEGTPISGEDMAALLQEAGFSDPVIEPVIPEYTAMVSARKP
jgi:2-hydroxy-4-(methylsulfanyl)butanoate S-methyltransferase